MSAKLFRHVSEKNSQTYLVSCFDAGCCRLGVLRIKRTSVAMFRLNDRDVRHTAALHTTFPV